MHTARVTHTRLTKDQPKIEHVSPFLRAPSVNNFRKTFASSSELVIPKNTTRVYRLKILKNMKAPHRNNDLLARENRMNSAAKNKGK